MLFMCFSQIGAPQDADQVEASLTELTENIRRLTDDRRRALAESDQLAADLAAQEKALGLVAREVEQLQAQVNTARDELGRMEAEESRLRQELSASQDALADMVRLAFGLSRQSVFAQWLGRDDPSRIGRTLAYLRYFSGRRARTIESVREQSQELTRIIARTRITEERLERALAEQRQLREQQQVRLNERARLLAAVRERAQEQASEIASLTTERDQLAELLEDLNQALLSIPRQLDYDSFSELKGKLAWPHTSAQWEASPGSTKTGGMHALGGLIGGDAGDPVRAVAPGRVVFADWLRGFGLLIIVDHGDEFLSLYAFNQSLYADVGEWVQSGSKVASVGNSGGRSEPGIYFELRHKGSPIDPRPWLASDS